MIEVQEYEETKQQHWQQLLMEDNWEKGPLQALKAHRDTEIKINHSNCTPHNQTKYVNDMHQGPELPKFMQ